MKFRFPYTHTNSYAKLRFHDAEEAQSIEIRAEYDKLNNRALIHTSARSYANSSYYDDTPSMAAAADYDNEWHTLTCTFFSAEEAPGSDIDRVCYYKYYYDGVLKGSIRSRFWFTSNFSNTRLEVGETNNPFYSSITDYDNIMMFSKQLSATEVLYVHENM